MHHYFIVLNCVQWLEVLYMYVFKTSLIHFLSACYSHEVSEHMDLVNLTKIHCRCFCTGLPLPFSFCNLMRLHVIFGTVHNFSC